MDLVEDPVVVQSEIGWAALQSDLETWGLVGRMEETFQHPKLHGAFALYHESVAIYHRSGAFHYQSTALHHQSDAPYHQSDTLYHQSEVSYHIHVALCHVHHTEISQDTKDHNSKVVLSVRTQVDTGTDLDLEGVVVAVNGMHYLVVVLMVVGDSYFHDVVLGAHISCHGAQKDGMLQQDVVVAVVAAAVPVEISDYYAQHIQNCRVVEVAKKLYMHPCCLGCFQ